MIKTYTDYKTVKLADLVPYARNSRKHSESQIAQIRASMREFGFTNDILIDEENTILAGHGRVQALLAEGETTATVKVLSGLSATKKKALVITDNKLALNASWDEELLANEITELAGEGFDTGLLGFDEKELEEIMSGEDENTAKEDGFDLSAALEKAAFVQTGDVWIVGRHRLICGDSTDTDTIKRLMDGRKANLLVTDPPYNVNYEGGNGLKIENDSMGAGEFQDFLIAAFTNVAENLEKGGAAYVFHADTEGEKFRKAFRETGFKLAASLIWVKNSFVFGRSDYHWKHEPILYGWLEGGKGHYFCGERNKSTVWEEKTPDFTSMSKKELFNFIGLHINNQKTTVLHFDKPKKNDIHPTMKPIELCGYLIHNSSKANAIVLDTFGGSGSTLVTCQQMDRICYTCELDTKYASAILRRAVENEVPPKEIWCERNGERINYTDVVREVENH